MRLLKIIFLIATLSIFYMSYKTNINDNGPVGVLTTSKSVIKVEVRDTIDHLIKALIHVESRGIDDAVNKSSNAVGCMQIRPIMVKDVNRILSKSDSEKRYTLKDRYSRAKSIEMFNVWRCYYHNKSSLEKISRCWNGGTKGHLRSCTLRYWTKVKEFYESNK
jgi:hypothetical protein